LVKADIFNLQGKVCVITGAGSGIGRTFCEAMAAQGSDVVCSDINENWAEETANGIKTYGIKTMAIKADVSNQIQVQNLFRKVYQQFGRLDILFNNAGITTRGARIHEMQLSDWNRVISIDLTGVFLCMKEGIKLMLRQQSGTIINISSTGGLVGHDPDILATSHYVAAKHGVIGLTKSAAAQYGNDNIRVNAIAPGFIEGTRLGDVEVKTEPQIQVFLNKVTSLTPMKRLGQLKELTGLAVLLASDASSFITGSVFVVDGGWCTW
jgi:NAD(P)-dependent dehydrogenase (short-subunit alcohol dehydrogenase family)